MFDFLSRKEPVALSIEPSLRFLSAGMQTKVIINSGADDLNQRISQVVLNDETTQGVSSLIVEGFDVIYTSFDFENIKDGLTKETNTEALSETKIIDKIQKQTDKLNPSSLTDFLNNSYQEINASKAKLIQDEIAESFDYNEGVVMGSVYLSLGSGEKQLLASPIYTVIPSKSEDEGDFEYVSASLVQRYIEEEWTDEFNHALHNLIGMSDARHNDARHNDDSSLWQKITQPTKTVFIAMLLGCGLVGYASAVIISNAIDDNNNISSSTSPYPTNSLYSTTPNATINASVQNNDGIPTAEEYAELQTKATQELLKKMNIDVSKPPSDLGCLTQ